VRFDWFPMKNILNILILVALLLCQATAAFFFGGAPQEYALPLYIGVTLLSVLWCVKLAFSRHNAAFASPLQAPILMFAAYAVFQYLRSPTEFDARIELLQVGMYLLVYFVAVANLDSARDRTALFVGLTLIAFAESFYALWQFTTKQDVVLWIERNGDYLGRGSGTYYCPNHLAGLLVPIICLIVAHIFIHRPHRGSVERFAIQKLTVIYCALFLIAGLWATLSRGGWIALAVALLAFLLWSEIFRVLSSRTVIIVFSLLIILGAGAFSIPSVRFRVQQAIKLNLEYTYETSPVEHASASSREPMWKSTAQIIRDHPVLGTGPGSWQWIFPKYRESTFQIRPQYTHSDALQLTAEYGLTGLLLVTLALAVFFYQAGRASHSANSTETKAFATGAAAGVIAILVHSLGDFNMHIPANALLAVMLMGATAAIPAGNNPSARPGLKPLPRIILAIIVLAMAACIAWFGIHTAVAARYTRLAEQAKLLQQWDAALATAQRAIHFDPRSPEAHAQLGDIYRLQSLTLDESAPDTEQYRLAKLSIAAFERSIQLNPYQVEALLRLAVSYELNDDNDRALGAYHQALDVDPNNGFIHLRLGIFCHRIGDTARAKEAFQKAATLSDPDNIAKTYLKQITGK
jgi:O-antigen ligase/cytochrome c-type biogenesis protein CcmH/NrfG